MYILCAGSRVITKILTDFGVRGLTSIGDELFVLLKRDDIPDNYQVEVYSINDNQLLRRVQVSEIIKDLTSCVGHNCLYMADWEKSCIRKYEAAGDSISEWSVGLPGQPLGLSVAPSGNLLVTCQALKYGDPNKLVELSKESGKRVREIALQSDIEYPHHSVQLTTGQLVVCHGYYNIHSPHQDSSHRVCLVGNDGKVTYSYNGQGRSDDVQLKWPRYLAVDEDTQFIFVADESKDRVVLLRVISPSELEFVRCVIEGLSRPVRLYFHQATRRLFVGHYWGGVSVIQLL